MEHTYETMMLCFQIPTTCPHDINFPFHTPPFHPILHTELLSIWVPGAQVIAVLSFNLELRGGHIHANFALVLSAEKK